MDLALPQPLVRRIIAILDNVTEDRRRKIMTAEPIPAEVQTPDEAEIDYVVEANP